MTTHDQIDVYMVGMASSWGEGLRRAFERTSECSLRAFDEGTDLRPPRAGVEGSDSAPRARRLAVVGTDADPEGGTRAVKELIEEFPNCEVLPASSRRDRETTARMIQLGARGFLDVPCGPDEIRRQVARVRIGRPRVVAIAGAAGGVGSTVLTVNLAAAVRHANPKQLVAIVDNDLDRGTAGQSLRDAEGESARAAPPMDLKRLVGQVERMDATLLKSVMALRADGSFRLGGPAGPEDADWLRDPRTAGPGPFRLLMDVLRDGFHSVFVDLAKSFALPDSAAIEASDAILLVVRPTPLGVAGAEKTKRSLMRWPGAWEKAQVVVNEGPRAPGADRVPRETIEEALGPVKAWIKTDLKLARAESRGAALFESGGAGRARRTIAELSQDLIVRSDWRAAGALRGLFGVLRGAAAF